MLHRLSKLVTAFGMAAALAAGSIPKPAAADTQSTINTALGAAAVIGGIILYNNYQHKKQAANTVVGYTRNGGTVYGDGRIVMPNGQTIYPNSNGTYPWGQTAYYNQNASGYTYDTQRTGRYDTTHRHGYGMRGAVQHPVPVARIPQNRYVPVRTVPQQNRAMAQQNRTHVMAQPNRGHVMPGANHGHHPDPNGDPHHPH